GKTTSRGVPEVVAVQRRDHGYEVQTKTADGAVQRTWSVTTYADALDLFEAFATHPDSNVRRLELAGFDDDSANNFVRSARLRDPGRIQVTQAERGASNISEMAAHYDFSTTTLSGTTV